MHIILGVEKGIFKKNGIDFQFIPFEEGGTEAMAAAAGGQAEMGSFGTPILIGISRGLQIKVIGSPVLKGNLFVWVGRTGIKTLRDLKGQTVATGALGGGLSPSAFENTRGQRHPGKRCQGRGHGRNQSGIDPQIRQSRCNSRVRTDRNQVRIGGYRPYTGQSGGCLWQVSTQLHLRDQ